jgi:hypothetical protein
MKNLFLIATAVAAIGSATTTHADACALHLPTFELTGFPISPHQVAVLGGAQVEERMTKRDLNRVLTERSRRLHLFPCVALRGPCLTQGSLAWIARETWRTEISG